MIFVVATKQEIKRVTVTGGNGIIVFVWQKAVYPDMQTVHGKRKRSSRRGNCEGQTNTRRQILLSPRLWFSRLTHILENGSWPSISLSWSSVHTSIKPPAPCAPSSSIWMGRLVVEDVVAQQSPPEARIQSPGERGRDSNGLCSQDDNTPSAVFISPLTNERLKACWEPRSFPGCKARQPVYLCAPITLICKCCISAETASEERSAADPLHAHSVPGRV